MKKLIWFLSFLIASVVQAGGVPFTVPNDSIIMGKSAAANKTFTFNIGGSNPQIRWNNGSSQLEFSNDGSTFNGFGTSSGLTLPTPHQYGLVVSGTGTVTTAITPNSSTVFPLVSGGSGASPAWSSLLVAGGGTGLVTATTNGMLFGNGTSAFGITGAGSQYQVFQAGASGVPTIGALNLAQAAAVTGVLPNGNTTATNSNTASTIVARDASGNFSAGAITATGANITSLNASNLSSGTVAAARLPNPSSSTLGGVESLASVSHNWINQISTSGVPSATQPAFSDISGTSTSGQLPADVAYVDVANTFTSNNISSYSGTASTAALALTGSPYVAGSSTTNKPQLLLEDASTSNGWAAAGTYLGINAKTGFTGDLINASVNGTRFFGVNSSGAITGTGANITSLNATNVTTGTLPAARLPVPTASTLGGVESLAAVSHNFLTSISTAGVPTQAQPAFTDISGSVAAAQLPNPSSSTLGGVESLAAVSHSWINTISTSGVPSATQPAFTDISGSVAASQLPNPTSSTLGGVESLASVSHNFLTSISTLGVPTQAQPAFSDISGSVAASQLPNPTSSTLGGVESLAAVSHNFLTSISTSGVPTQAQPAFTDISGSVAASQMPAFTGDVTTSAGAVANTIAANAVTNAKAAQMAAHTYKGNNTGSTANALDLTATQLTAELNAVVGDSGSGGTKGLVPAAGSGDAAAGKFLKADGTFAVPPGSGGGTLTTKGDIQGYSSAAASISVGVNGQRLIADSNQTLGVRYQDDPLKNYIINADAEVGTEVWATYGNTAQNTPVTAAGGSPSSTWTRTTSSPLRGTASFLWTRTANNRQGEGVAYPFTIDSVDQTRVLQIAFDYKIASGTFVAADGVTAPLNDGTVTQNAGMSDLEVFVYDVTNSVLVPVSPQVLTSTSTTSAKFKGIFQAASNSTSYKLAIHTARSTAVAFTAQFDNFYVGPQVLVQGAPVTDFATDSSFSVSAGFGTITSQSIQKARVGDTMHVHGSWINGTVAGSVAYIQLPSGLTIDTTKFGSGAVIVGMGTGETSASQDIFPNNLGTPIFYDGSTNNQLFFARKVGSNTLTKANGNDFLTNSSGLSFNFRVPISGWSSTVQMSNDTSATVVAASYTSSAVAGINNNSEATIPLTTLVYNIGGGSVSSNQYTVPVSGVYEISVNGGPESSVSTGYTTLKARKNSTAIGTSSSTNYAATLASPYTYMTAVWTTNCVAGDVLDARMIYGSSGNVNISATVNFKRISGPSTIAATETVGFYAKNPTASVSGSYADMSWTSQKDSHGAFNGSTTYTVPSAGWYNIAAHAQVNGTYAAGATSSMQILQNGSAIDIIIAEGTVSGGFSEPMLNRSYYFLAGDTIKLQVKSSATGPTISGVDIQSGTLNIFRR